MDDTTGQDLPSSYWDDVDVQNAVEALDSGAPLVFILGRAGTGKTTLIKHLTERDKEIPQVVLAPTGVAALNARGQTIHSFFRLPTRVLDEEALSQRRSNKLWRKIKRVIIDEISMVRVDVLDAIDFVLRRARKDPRPFGGVQLVLVGDFLQLPPVAPRREAEMLKHMGYSSPFVFSAKIVQNASPRFVRLTTVHRQTDPYFVDILSLIRDRVNLDVALSDLNASCFQEHRADRKPMILTGTNARASHYNEAGLRAIDLEPETFVGKATGSFELKQGRPPAPEQLSLKAGARVMAIKNDPQGRWVNGSLGTVKSMARNHVTVVFDGDGKARKVEQASWENIRYQWDADQKKVEAEVVGAYSQFPLILAWAATIHKAQGLTLDDVRVDLERGAFASGQTYVAISRARTMAGLSFTRALRPSDIIVDPILTEFEHWIDDLQIGN